MHSRFRRSGDIVIIAVIQLIIQVIIKVVIVPALGIFFFVVQIIFG